MIGAGKDISPFSMAGPPEAAVAQPMQQGMRVAPAGYNPRAVNTAGMSPQQAQAITQAMGRGSQFQQASANLGGMAPQVQQQLIQQAQARGPAATLGARMGGLQGATNAPIMPQAGAQPVQGMQRANTPWAPQTAAQSPPTGAAMNPQYQQALISSLRGMGQ